MYNKMFTETMETMYTRLTDGDWDEKTFMKEFQDYSYNDPQDKQCIKRVEFCIKCCVTNKFAQQQCIIRC